MDTMKAVAFRDVDLLVMEERPKRVSEPGRP